MNTTVNEVLQFIRENDVKFIRLGFCDIFGLQKNISIMPDELAQAFEYGISFDASAIRASRMSQSRTCFLFLIPLRSRFCRGGRTGEGGPFLL